MAAEKERVQSGVWCIPDGYTLRGTIKDDTRPAMSIWYRPALPEEVADYQSALARTTSGPERVAAQATFLNAHIVRWSGVYKITRNAAGEIVEDAVDFNPNPKDWKKSALGDPGVRRGLGTNYLSEMSNLICGYSPGEWEEDSKN